jgi:hypothetical protein
MKKLLLTGLLILAVSTAHAHAPAKGKNGGQQTDAGSYHVEVIVKDKAITVFLTDHSDKLVATKGFKATAILVVDGKAERIALSPEGDNKLVGAADVDLKAPIKGAIQITNSANGTVQAKF